MKPTADEILDEWYGAADYGEDLQEYIDQETGERYTKHPLTGRKTYID